MNLHVALAQAQLDAPGVQPWRDRRRHRILAAAGRVFARASFEQASMDEIAGEAGVGKPTLYRYFASKDALFAAVFEHALDELEDELGRILRDMTGARERLAAMVAALVPTIREHLAALRFLGDTAAGADQSKRRVFRERRGRIASCLQRTIDEGVAAGEIRSVDGARVGQILIGMVWSATVAIDAPDEEVGRDIVELVLNGLLPASERVPASRDGSSPPRRDEPAAPLRRGAQR